MSEHLRNVQQELQHTQVTKLIALAKLTNDKSNKLSFDFQQQPKTVRLRGDEFFSVYLFTYFYAQDLLNARKREIETENHMKQIGMYM